MITIFDNAMPTSLATNAACPQRPSWQISPVGYKWAQAVLLDCKQAQASRIRKRMEVTPMIKKTREAVLFAFTRAKVIFRMRSAKLFSVG